MPGADHYFSPSPGSRRRQRTVTLRLQDVALDLRTDRGVFSAGRIDPGTLLLLKHAPLPPPPPGSGDSASGGRVLADVGCGYGPIAVTLGLRAPDAAVWAVDVNERARQLAAANLAAAGVTVGGAARWAGDSARAGNGGQAADSARGRDGARPGDGEWSRGGGQATVCAPEEVPAALRFDAVYCNPPVRIGNRALDELLREWMGRLRPDGFAVLVMHKNLGADSLVRRLAAAGAAPRRLAVGGGYRVLQVPAAREAES